MNKSKRNCLNVSINTLDSGEDAEESSQFLKGGTMLLSWCAIDNFANTEKMFHYGMCFYDAIMMQGKRKSMLLMLVNCLVDSNTSSVNTHKDQHERKIGKVKRSRIFRDEFTRELREWMINYEAIDVIVTRNFNGDEN